MLAIAALVLLTSGFDHVKACGKAVAMDQDAEKLLIWSETGLYKVIDKVGSYIDVVESGTGYFNAKKSLAFVVDSKQGTLYEYQFKEKWASRNAKDFIKIISTIENKYNISKESFKKTEITNETVFSNDLRCILDTIGFSGVVPDKLLKLLKIETNLLTGDEWKGSFILPGFTHTSHGQSWFYGVFIGYSKFLHKVGLSTFNGAKLDLNQIVKQNGTIFILFNLLKQLMGKADIIKILMVPILHPVFFLEVLHDLSGGKTSWSDGVINILYRIDLMLHGNFNFDKNCFYINNCII